ncbi:hypothetical protein [Clostridium sp. M14]|uniref:hypothetical protein n=1 Tax=Clostridium sp. M14 TaxID=2716311 RepID=UPI0013EEBEDE|nr:hypothetical protein [Clostridium sp. M14]MBZ9691411.1 hypothetical protein [Clostridium sp. M14]
MNNIMGFIIITIFICGLSYGFLRQIKETSYIIKINKFTDRSVIGNLICSISYGAFLISYILNVLISLEILGIFIITSENTSFSCGIFLMISLISKYIIVPKKQA